MPDFGGGGGYGMAAGTLTDIAGTVLRGIAAEDARDEVMRIANTPGIDTGMLTGQALTDQLRYLPQATQISNAISQANQAQLSAREEAAMPGVGAARQKALANVNGLFADDAEWLKGVQRRGAALGLSSGLMGSQAGQLATLRLSDQEKMARTQLGTGLLGSLISGMRIANTPGVQSFLGPNPSELINLRSQERTQKMDILMRRAGMPTQLEVYGQNLQAYGGTLTGASMTGGGTGGIFGGGAGGGYASGRSSYMSDYSQGVNPWYPGNSSAGWTDAR